MKLKKFNSNLRQKLRFKHLSLIFSFYFMSQADNVTPGPVLLTHQDKPNVAADLNINTSKCLLGGAVPSKPPNGML